jgi:hypothetical protein
LANLFFTEARDAKSITKENIALSIKPEDRQEPDERQGTVADN